MKSPFCIDRGGHAIPVWNLMEGLLIQIFCELCFLRNVCCFCKRWSLSSPLCMGQCKAYYCPQAVSEGLHGIEFLPLFQPLDFLQGCDSWFPSTREWKSSPEQEIGFGQHAGLLTRCQTLSQGLCTHLEAPGSQQEMRQIISFSF